MNDYRSGLFKASYPAPPGQTFSPDLAVSFVGKAVKGPDGNVIGRVVSAVVLEDGSRLVYEMDLHGADI